MFLGHRRRRRNKICWMDDADLKWLIENAGAETSRHFDVAAEGISRRVDHVAEAVAQVDGRLTRSPAVSGRR
jgi:hypothetical protein